MTQRLLDRARRRTRKPSYNGFSPAKVKIIKAQLRIWENSAQCANIEQELKADYGTVWRIDTSQLKNSDWPLYITLIDLQEKNNQLRQRIANLEAHNLLDRDRVMQEFREYNSRRLSGGSF